MHDGPGLRRARPRPLLAAEDSAARLGTGAVSPRLPREAVELIFAVAERISEGEPRQTPSGRTYYGSTMLTVQMEVLREHWRRTLDPALLLAALEGSVGVHLRAMRLACADAAHRAPSEAFDGTAIIDTRIYLVADSLHIDVDVEVPLDLADADRHAQ